MPNSGIRFRIKATEIGTFEVDLKSARKVMAAAAREVARDIKTALRSASGGGRLYGNSGGNKYKPYARGRHQASSPGNAPATQTGYLSNSVIGRAFRSGQGFAVRDKAFYSAALERGASGPGKRTLAARPFLQATLDRKWPSIQPKILAALRDGIKYKASRKGS